MAVLMIAGSGRGAGKTAVGCALIAAMPELQWAAVKVSPHEHEIAPVAWEEVDRDSEKDTGRYLRAGAQRAFLVTASDDAGGDVVRVRKMASECDSILMETNREPADLIFNDERMIRLAVLAGSPRDWKASLPEAAERADGLILTTGLLADGLPAVLRRKRIFIFPMDTWTSSELIHFVRGKLMA